MKVYEIDGIVPVVDPSAFVHPSAVLIGDVVVGAGAYIGPCASLRGDFGRLFIGAGANVQDCCVMHGFPGSDTIVEERGHIGHGAILHGCIVRSNGMVGMNAVVMDNAVVGESAIVAAQSFVKAGMDIPPRMLAGGVPAKVMRELTELEMAWKVEGTGVYLDLVKRCHGTLREVEALSAVEPGRQRLNLPELKTLQATRRDKE
jgi:phenylacetic acid degradation protein